MRALALLAALLCGTTAASGPWEVEAVWRAWAKQSGADFSTLAIRVNGEPFGAWGHQTEADTVLPLASLSKAITGACIMELHREGLVDVNAPLSRVLADRPDILPPTSTDTGQITVAQLLTHTSGLGPDSTQTALFPPWWGLAEGHDSLSSYVLRRTLENRGISDNGFSYNNENYAVLGSVIQHITGQSIENACAPRVLQGLETARPSPQYGSTLAYAGWAMSVADYARFADSIDRARDWPEVDTGGGVNYGPGVDVEPEIAGATISHSGSYCLGLRNGGSFFAQLPNGITFALAHDLCLYGDAFWDLNDALIEAAKQ